MRGKRKYSFEEVNKVKHIGGGLVVTYWVHHNIATIFTYLFANKNISPNTITFLSFIVWLIGCILIVSIDSITWLGAILIYVLFNLSYTLDCCDGQVARLTGKGSIFGDWLDHVLDGVGNSILLSAIYWHIVKSLPETNLELVFIFYSFSLFVISNYHFAIHYKSATYGKNFKLFTNEEKTKRKVFTFLMNIAKNIVDMGLFLFVLLLLPFPKILLYTLLAYYSLQFIQLIALFVLMYIKGNPIPN